MKPKQFFVWILFFLSYCTNAEVRLVNIEGNATTTHAITYKLENWRRLGDNLLTYVKAKYFSHLFKLPVLYKPFPYSDQFSFSLKELSLQESPQRFTKTIIVNTAADIQNNIQSTQALLFECHFLSEAPSPYMYSRYPESAPFECELKTMLAPLCPIEALPKPPSVITVGVHVRKGGGFDRPLGSLQEYESPKLKGLYLRKNNPQGPHTDIYPLVWCPGPKYIEAVETLIENKNLYSDYTWPVKFPADQFYIDQIKEVSYRFPHNNLLVYIFTDDPYPETIVNRYSKALIEYPRIIFSYRASGNHHTKNVLTDLFLMTQCDCLISANSSFASIAQLIGNHSLLIFPMDAITLPDKIIISKIGYLTISNSLTKDRTLHFETVNKKIK